MCQAYWLDSLQDDHNMCTLRYIDGRVWPKEDELEVRLMMDLIHHVTGMFPALCASSLKGGCVWSIARLMQAQPQSANDAHTAAA